MIVELNQLNFLWFETGVSDHPNVVALVNRLTPSSPYQYYI